jgi:hypothetical protein
MLDFVFTLIFHPFSFFFLLSGGLSRTVVNGEGDTSFLQWDGFA